RSARPWISIDLVEERRVVGKVEEPGESVERPGTARQIIVVLFPAMFATESPALISSYPTKLLAQFESVFFKDAGRCLGPGRAEADAIEGKRFDFDSRNAEVSVTR